MRIKRIQPIWFFYSLVAIYFIGLKLYFPGEGMGWQDDATYFSPITDKHFYDPIIDYYMFRCGRLGEMTNVVMMNLITHFIGFTPFSFPWFTLRLLGAAFVALSFGNFTHGILKLSGTKLTFPAYIVYFLGFTFLALNVPLSGSMSLVIIHVNYCTPIFICSWVFRWMSNQPNFTLKPLHATLLTVFCWYMAVTHEQLLFTMSLLLPGIVLFNYFSERINWKQFVKQAIITVILVASAATTVLLAPGQTARMKTLDPSGKTVLHLFWWVFESTTTLLKLTTLPEGWHGPLARPILYILTALTVGVFYGIYKNRGKLITSESKILYFSVLFMWMGYMTQITQLVSLYFPDRARILPMHHYMVGLGLFVFFIYLIVNKYFSKHYEAFAIAASIFLIASASVRIPMLIKNGVNWWDVWSQIGNRSAIFYKSLYDEASRSKEIIHFDYDLCHIAQSYYDVPESSLALIRWAKLDQKVEVFSNKKIYNPLPKEWPRKKTPFPCKLGL